MKRIVLSLLLTWMLTPAIAEPAAALNLIIFPGGLSWPAFVAQDKGSFEKQGIAIKVTETPGSVFQGLLAGDFDIPMTPFDNVIAYQEDQGEVHFDAPPDLFVFMGGISSTLRLIVRPEIKSFADLKDRVLGVDALSTGYSPLVYRLLEQNGLPQGSYKLERLGGTATRVQAVMRGKIAGTMVSSPQEILPEENGFKRLGDIQGILGNYQALSGVARRSWALAHPDRLEEFIRAYVAANDWLADPANPRRGCGRLRQAYSQLATSGDRQGVGRHAFQTGGLSAPREIRFRGCEERAGYPGAVWRAQEGID